MKEATPALYFRTPQVNFLERTISASGKYLLFLGTHFEAGHTCWVVGISNKATGEILMRHYNDSISGCVAPRAQAYTYWEEFKKKMTEKRTDDEYEPEYLEELQKYIQKPGGRPK